MTRSLVLDYDEYHTPLAAIAAALDGDEERLVLQVDLGGDEGRTPRTGVPQGWGLVSIDARAEFSAAFVSRAIKANAVYQDGCALSAALSRPLLASVCTRVVKEAGIDRLVHGLAGNDQIRLEMALEAVAPDLEVQSVAALLGSQNDVNADTYSVSSNLWGNSVEGADLRDIATRSSLMPVGTPGSSSTNPAIHVVSFEEGLPVALDGGHCALHEVIRQLDDIGRAVGFGRRDVVEDGSVGLKTRSVYEAPAAFLLVLAHRDLERTVSTREQNRFKPGVDRAWTDLVYDGQWFDDQRLSLDAYIDVANQWVTGDVTLALHRGGAMVLARSSPYALYDDREAIYRFGQDFAVGATSAIGRARSAGMRASVLRRLSATDRTQGNESPWIA
jgi:argininosuccinate synthase